MRINLEKEFKNEVKKQKRKTISRLLDRLVLATPVDTGEARQGWRSEGDSIINDVEHIEHLNEGSSKQAPTHFVERTVLTQPGVRPSGTIVRKK